MAVSMDRVYRLTNYSTFLGQQLVNVFWYGCGAGATVTAQGVIDIWQDEVRDVIRDIQSTEVDHYLVECVDVNDISDFASEVQAVTGTVSGAPEPSFVALSFRGSQPLYGWKRPAKRIGGIPDDWINGNQIVAGGAAITLVATALGATLVQGATNLYPLVVRRPTPVGDEPLPLPWAEVPVNYVSQPWAFHRVGTQNSRKVAGA